MKKPMTIMLTLALSVTLVSGCTFGKKKEAQGERVLRIATSNGSGPDDEYFRQQFTEVFEFANPNIKIEIVPTQDTRYMYGGGPAPGEKQTDPFDTLKEVMTGPNPPDIVVANLDQLPELVTNNMLTPLESYITKDKFDTEGIVPVVLDGLKNAGDGKLYALAPTFSSSALIYNKKMFTDAGVEFPHDDMTWDELFDLAKRLNKPEGDKPVYGFNFSQGRGDLFYSMGAYASPLGLKLTDDKGETMTVDTDDWEAVWKKMQQLQTDKVLPPAPDQNNPKPMINEVEQNNPFAWDDFMSGRVAMTIVGYNMVQQLTNANRDAEKIKGYTPIDWDVVTIPSHEQAKGVASGVSINGVMGINAKAANPDDAWKFLKFVNGEDWAKLKSHSSYQLVSRKKFIQPKEGQQFHMEAFTNIKPAPGDLWNDFYKLSRQYPNIYTIQEIGRRYLNDAMANKIGVREALKKWQTEGNQALKQMKENPNGTIQSSAGDVRVK